MILEYKLNSLNPSNIEQLIGVKVKSVTNSPILGISVEVDDKLTMDEINRRKKIGVPNGI